MSLGRQLWLPVACTAGCKGCQGLNWIHVYICEEAFLRGAATAQLVNVDADLYVANLGAHMCTVEILEDLICGALR